jgi:hypothetical protein
MPGPTEHDAPGGGGGVGVEQRLVAAGGLPDLGEVKTLAAVKPIMMRLFGRLVSGSGLAHGDFGFASST